MSYRFTVHAVLEVQKYLGYIAAITTLDPRALLDDIKGF
jgi:hypothetical protein